jgi:acetyl esterase/lipase
VPVEHSELLADALSAHGVAHDVLVLPWARHAFDIIPDGLTSQLARQTIDAFLNDTAAARPGRG